ncbi:MAG: hypothetical protein ACJAZC_001938 [Cryomorphaceae bacterium]|jgi:uncharacterized protein involved in exopolysaccharide biosynthesis
MSGYQSIKRQLLPLIKGLPIIALFFLAALLIASQMVNYTPNTYQTIALVKLDNQINGLSNNQLYSDFDVFSTESKIQAEAAVLNSRLLIGMALDSLDYSVSLYRKGQVRNAMLYGDSPISISYRFVNAKLFDEDYFVNISSDKTFQLVNKKGEPLDFPETALGDVVFLDGGMLKIEANPELLYKRELQLEGDYIIHIFSRDGLIADVSGRLNIVEVDKEIPIIRVVYRDQHPKKVADLANRLCKTYIEDYVEVKSQAAAQTVKFINQKLAEVQEELRKTEIALEQYKAVNGVVNTQQETETGLRQISRLEVQLINLEMNEKAVLELEEYISGGDYFKDRSINFGFGDLLMTELVKKLKMWQDERIDLLIKYTEESDELNAVDQKIEELKKYIVEAIKRNKVEIMTKKSEIKKSLEVVSKQFDGLSTREKELRVLERNFNIQEQVYNFLSQKKIEASIAASANLSFHRIIQEATVPREPVAPNKKLITFLAGFFSLILAITLIYLEKYVRAKVTGRHDIERHSALPLLGLIRSGNSTDDFIGIAKTMKLKNYLKDHSIIAINSTVDGEGKSYVALNLAECLAKMDRKVALLSHQNFKVNSMELEVFLSLKEKGSARLCFLHRTSNTQLDFEDELEQLKQEVDIVIIDSVASGIGVEGIEAMAYADVSLYIIRSNKTSIDYLCHADRLVEEYQLENVMLVLNDAHKASNHSGNFVGTRFRNQPIPKSLKLKVKTYLSIYFR